MKVTELGGSKYVFLIEELDDMDPVVLKYALTKPNPGEKLNERQKLEFIEENRHNLVKHGIETPTMIRDQCTINKVHKAFIESGTEHRDIEGREPIVQTFCPDPIMGIYALEVRNGGLKQPVDISGFDDFKKNYEQFRDETGIAHNDFNSLNITLSRGGRFGLIDWGNAVIRDIDGIERFQNAVCTEDLLHDMMNSRVVESIRTNTLPKKDPQSYIRRNMV